MENYIFKRYVLSTKYKLKKKKERFINKNRLVC